MIEIVVDVAHANAEPAQARPPGAPTLPSAHRLSARQQEILAYLTAYHGELVCRRCLAEITNTGQIARDMLTLREAGYAVENPAPRAVCETHGNAHHDRLIVTTPGQSTSRYEYSARERRRIRGHLPAVDAFTNRPTTSKLQLDHRVPAIRWDSDEQPVDPNDEVAVRGRFQMLTQANNLRKSRACERCVATGERVRVHGIAFWFEGDGHYDPAVGCNGCPLAYPERWREEVEVRLGVRLA